MRSVARREKRQRRGAGRNKRQRRRQHSRIAPQHTPASPRHLRRTPHTPTRPPPSREPVDTWRPAPGVQLKGMVSLWRTQQECNFTILCASPGASGAGRAQCIRSCSAPSWRPRVRAMMRRAKLTTTVTHANHQPRDPFVQWLATSDSGQPDHYNDRTAESRVRLDGRRWAHSSPDSRCNSPSAPKSPGLGPRTSLDTLLPTICAEMPAASRQNLARPHPAPADPRQDQQTAPRSTMPDLHD